MRLLIILYFAIFANLCAENKYNVLMICVDDLRNELGCYGVEEVISPNFDKLASQSMNFDHHYVQVPTSGASRHNIAQDKPEIVSELLKIIKKENKL